MFEYFTDRAIQAILLAQEESRRLGHRLVGSEQILLGLLGEQSSPAAQLLAAAGVTLEGARARVEALIGRGAGMVPDEVPFTPKVKALFEAALAEARQQGQKVVAPEHLLLAIIRDRDNSAVKVLRSMDVDPDQLRINLIRLLGETAAVAAGDRGESRRESTGDRTDSGNILATYCTNLTQAAIEDKLDPVVGRDREIERVVQILGRRTKNNPILIGEPGVGKTAIAEGLAQRIALADVPETLLDKQVYSLDMGRLLAGTQYRGAFEERLKELVSEVQRAGNVIVFIDEVHTLLGAGGMQGGLSAGNLLKPALARGQLQCLGATTLDEYRQYIERDAALERRFQPVKVGEPTPAEAIEILRGLRSTYETFHNVLMTDEAIAAAVTLADRYIADRFLPDKAIDLIDEAGSRARVSVGKKPAHIRDLEQQLAQTVEEKEQAVENQDFETAAKLRDRELVITEELAIARQTPATDRPRPTITAEDIAEIVSLWTGVPVTQLSEAEVGQLLNLEAKLHERLIGQNEAIEAVSKALRRARSGLRNLERPIASFLFLGPTGVGKTELAKALANFMFGSDESIIRIDMSEFMEPQSTSKLIGSPPGFVGYGDGGQLTEAVRRRPYSLVLFDEVEKAHPDVFNLMLQLLDEGRLTDSQGRVVSFRNSLIVMTSNLGAKAIAKGGANLGFGLASDSAEGRYQAIRDRVTDELKNFFRPEFLNRLDEVVVFRPLEKSEVRQIVDLLVVQVADRLVEQDIRLTASDRFKDKVADEGFDSSLGARPLRRKVTQLLEDALAEAILSGRIKGGDRVLVDVADNGETLLDIQSQAIDLRLPASVS
ncbi:Clp protease ClpX [Limnothrix sp. PR1529]|uniref:ATP-dependent Clp protease ATP-binding subunit n=1 Tax=Limnothrix sp. PR1529 TaxID=1704291 RepID=UPI00081F69F7|nr:ATP-dependent Clp protease ATP-binding subunit [Limnothrix sp. PR1529]OCQ91027.1 ATP-dependent Clp protease ATP-binding subunit ClpC [Limnothrix sp. P13C2]PIB10636.1 Clp protease ClpX [Limnothrix sp. PR1529]